MTMTLEDVRTRVLSADESDALKCVADMVGLPHPSDIPRPGQVVAWSYEDWKSWGSPFGFTQEDRSKHCYVIIHDKLPTLRIAKASTSGDVRSGLNMGTSVRQMILRELRFLLNMAACMLEKHADTTVAGITAALVSADDRKYWAPHVQLRRSGHIDDRADRLGKQLSLTLAALGKFDVSPKLALARAGVEAEDLERILVVLKSGLTPKTPDLDDIVESLRDQLENERELETQAGEAKVQARAAEAVKPAADELDKAEILFNAETTRGKTRMTSAVRGFHERVGQLANAAKGLAEALEGSLFPSFPTERFKELKTEAALARTQLAAAVSDMDVLEATEQTLTDQVAHLNALVAELQHEKVETEKLFNEAAVGPEWKAACLKLVAKLEPLLASDSFLMLAAGVGTARVVLADAKKAIDAGVAPTVV